MRRAGLFVLAVALVAVDIAATAAQRPSRCRSDPELVERCRIVRGRLSVANGTPALRIWIVGTRRILGVSGWGMGETERELLPGNVWTALGDRPLDRDVFGDFEVCPFTRQRLGWMQMVCVASARNLVSRTRRD